jgi:hypothetical protein
MPFTIGCIDSGTPLASGLFGRCRVAPARLDLGLDGQQARVNELAILVEPCRRLPRVRRQLGYAAVQIRERLDLSGADRRGEGQDTGCSYNWSHETSRS